LIILNEVIKGGKGAEAIHVAIPMGQNKNDFSSYSGNSNPFPQSISAL
jgi:hypothetical protein